MALYRIENDTCLGITHSGGAVNVESEGYVELSDEEVAKIVDLIRQKGTTDIDELELEDVEYSVEIPEAIIKVAEKKD